MWRQDQRIYEFANFRLDLGERVLSRDGEVIPLRPKLFDLLVYLIENRGQILEKEEITRAVWGSLSQGSADSPSANLNVNISNLRHELGDDPEKPVFIETLKGRGYRFLPLAHAIEPPPARASRIYLSAVGATSGAKPARLPEPDALLDDVAAEWGGAAEHSAPSGVTGAPTAQAEKPASTPPAGGRRAVFLRWTLIAATVAIAALALAAWGVTRNKNDRAASANSAADKSTNRSPGDASNPAGAQFAGFQAGDVSAVAPRIDSIEPASPNAWIGDGQIKVNGRGFRQGLSVMMLFPGGGSGANLTGVAVLNVTPESFILKADFNNNPGEYSIRVDLAEGLQSNWWPFDVLPINLLPEIDEVRQGRVVNGKLQVTVNGRNFIQHVHAVIIHPGGHREFLSVSRPSAWTFSVLFDPRGQTGPFRIQAQNAGKVSNVVSFNAAN